MKNKFLILLTILLFGIFNPVFSIDDSSYMSIDEYSRFFEMGFMDEEEPSEEKTEEPFVPKLKEKFDLDGKEVIGLEEAPVKLNIERVEFLDPYREVFQPPKSRNDLFKRDKFTLFSDGSKELSDYMTNNFKSTMNISYDLNDTLMLRAGHETWYVNPNASVGAKKFYFNPRVNLTDRCYLDYISRYNQTSKNIEQEVGLNYRPKLFKDAASFGIKASTVIDNETHEVQSGKLKFSTDLYIY